MEKFTAWFTAKRRKYIYRVATAGLGLAAAYGVLSAEEVTVWGAFLATAFVTGMADANTDPNA